MFALGSRIFKDLFIDIFWEVFYFPIWWYSRGLKKTALFCLQKIKGGWRALALSILLVNFFKPMYGQRGWPAYVLSLNAHFWQIIWRILAMILWLVFWLFVLIIWLVLPILTIWQMVI